jgi:hypothetical protein
MMGKLWPVLLMLCLGGCADITFQDKQSRTVAPFFFAHRERPSVGETYLQDENEVYRPMQELNLAQKSDEEAHNSYVPEARLPANCSLSDRFDRDGALAYNFNDRQTRLSLHVDGDAGFGGFEVEKVMLKFRYKFQKPAHSRKDACRYPSGFQGLVGSGYNEFFRRRNNTVWDEISDRNLTGIFD